jgi:hypothetical protein
MQIPCRAEQLIHLVDFFDENLSNNNWNVKSVKTVDSAPCTFGKAWWGRQRSIPPQMPPAHVK